MKKTQIFYKGYKFISMAFLMLLAAQGFSQSPFYTQNKKGQLLLTEKGASHFARLALDCLQREYPNKLNQVLKTEEELRSPKSLHPAFYGCFDWHSSVHGHWMLVRLLKLFPNMEEAAEIRQKLNENLTPENIGGEVEYFKNSNKSWERMYGWSWLVKLTEELYTWKDKDGRNWYLNLKPLAESITERYLEFLKIQEYPVRTGVHPNTAFGLSFAWDFANATQHKALLEIINKRAKDYFLADENCPADWEPSGEDFLSACLEEARLMSRVLPTEAFESWFDKFLPDEKLAALSTPADVSDRSDPKIVHLDGVNLSRAWCLYSIAESLKNSKKRKIMYKIAGDHLAATVPNIASEHYEGTHWLASFAVYALSVN